MRHRYCILGETSDTIALPRRVYSRYGRIRKASMHISQTLQPTKSAETQADTVQPSIHAIKLTKAFGKSTVVNELSLSVYPGELYALLGDNGAGKTTTVNMLTTLLEPTAGQFFICGFDGIKQVEKTKSAFGVVSQEVAVYGELTAFENLAFIADLYGIPKKEASERILALLKQSGLADRVHDRAGEFSTGMQRKLSIAIAMLHKPRVIFMDEPTVGLDPASRRQIWQSLSELKRSGVTVLLTTHYLEEAEYLADRIGIIRKGQLVMEGTIDQLRQSLRSVRNVVVVLAERTTPEVAEKLIQSFVSTDNKGTAEFDAFRNSITFTPPRHQTITEYLESVLAWLKREQIVFEKFATSEPSLEEIFLAVQSARDTSQA